MAYGLKASSCHPLTSMGLWFWVARGAMTLYLCKFGNSCCCSWNCVVLQWIPFLNWCGKIAEFVGVESCVDWLKIAAVGFPGPGVTYRYQMFLLVYPHQVIYDFKCHCQTCLLVSNESHPNSLIMLVMLLFCLYSPMQNLAAFHWIASTWLIWPSWYGPRWCFHTLLSIGQVSYTQFPSLFLNKAKGFWWGIQALCLPWQWYFSFVGSSWVCYQFWFPGKDETILLVILSTTLPS